MIYRLICVLLIVVLALPASALGEGMIEWDRATVEVEAKAPPEPEETTASFEGMTTLPPADALKTEGPLVPVDLPEAPAKESGASADAPATATPEVTFAPIPEADIGGDGLLRISGGRQAGQHRPGQQQGGGAHADLGNLNRSHIPPQSDLRVFSSRPAQKAMDRPAPTTSADQPGQIPPDAKSAQIVERHE